jgi:hypothetical protein
MKKKPTKPNSKKATSKQRVSAAAQQLGQRGGLKGGAARAAKLTPERRRAIASAGARARWSPMSAAELLTKDFSAEERALDAACRWKFKPETLALVAVPTGHGYGWEIDLERCTSSAPLLDSILQAASKAWIDDAMLGELVRKLDRLFDVQATFCAGGKDHRVDPKARLAGKK